MNSRGRRTVLVGVGVLGGLFALLAGGLWALPAFFSDRVLPGVAVAGVRLYGETRDDARQVLAERLQGASAAIRLTPPGRSVSLAELGVTLDLERMVEAAVSFGRASGGTGIRERLVLLRGVDLPAIWHVDRSTLEVTLRRTFPDVFREPVAASWEITAEGSFVYQPGQPGARVVMEEVERDILDRLQRQRTDPVSLRIVEQPVPKGNVAGVETARVLSGPLTLLAGEDTQIVPSDVRAGWVRQPADGSAPRLDRTAIAAYVRETLAPALARAAVNAQFEVDGSRARVFVPPADGREVLVPETADGILRGIAAGAVRISVVTRPAPPAVAVTPLMEQYGIRTRVAQGESDFAGSPRNRIHNITVGAQKYHGLLIPPGAEFSFNENLGPVDAANGFLPELVILSNVTTPQYGGGLCQVSTTMFRSAIHAGLPITARRNHAYAVSYYGTPGFDATIYPPNPDLRFVNDTPGHLLIQMEQVGTTLAFELWGSPDGREVEVLGPFPFEKQPNGAVKARLVRKVAKNGQVQRDEWFSNYKSPKLFPKVLAANAERETWDERVRRIEAKDRRIQEEFERKKAELERSTRQRHAQEPASARPVSRPTPTPVPPVTE